MKKTTTNLWFVLGLLLMLISCRDDDTIQIDSIPEFQSLATEISSLPGQTFLFTAKVSDPAGIRSINFKYDPWFLDKTIEKKDSLYQTYDLSYKFKVPQDAEENSSHSIAVTVTNSGGKSITREVVVTLNQDIANPIIQISKPADGTTVLIGDGAEIEFDITVTDTDLAEFKIESDVLNETIPIEGTSYTYTKSLDIADEGSYVFTVTATDGSGNVASETISVNVFHELLFDVMYIADVTTNEALNSDLFGVPYNTEASEIPGEDGYVFTARYYAPSPNSEVRFLPQRGSFEPFTYGANPDVPGELLLGAGADVDPVVLPQRGYYEIKIDLRSQSYTVTPYSPADTPFEQIYLIGRGILVGNSSTCINNTTGATQCWHFNSGKPFVKDTNNPYLWSLDVTVIDQPNDNDVNGFIVNANPSGWNPFWRMNPSDPSKTIPNDGTNYVFPESALNKNYTFVFDTHLNRLSVLER